MPVIGIDQVPRNLQRPSIWSDIGYGSGKNTRDLLMGVLLQQMGNVGQVPTSPTPQNPGTFNFPPGSQSPLEAAQIQQMGGVPTRGQPFLSKSTQMPGTGVSFTQPTRFGFRPDLSYLQREAELRKTTAELAGMPTEQAYKRAQTGQLEAQTAFDKYVVEQGLLPIYDANGVLKGYHQRNGGEPSPSPTPSPFGGIDEDADVILQLKKAALDPSNPNRAKIIQLLRESGEL